MTPFGSDLILARLQALHPKKIDLSLARILGLLDTLGNPERRLPPVVHIAGTNGKGSTLAMLDAMLTAAGLRVHRYISPHLVRFNERILLEGEPIPESRLAQVLDRCERANAGAPITFFEITTAAAFLAFAEEPADILLLETGLGGRLDATNVVERPLLTLISPISMDHESFLGTTIEAIAGEKAGILKPGVPAIVGPQRPEAQAVLDRRAAEIGALIVAHGRDWSMRDEGEQLVLREGDREARWPRPSLAGVHQSENAGLAIMAAHRLGALSPDDAAIADGLRRARWAARLQRLTQGPLASGLPPGSELWLDGGHNPAAGEVLARSLPAITRGRPLHLVVGMLNSKDLPHFAEPLARIAASIHTVPVPDEAASRDPGEAAQELAAVGIAAKPALSVGEAVANLSASLAAHPGVVLVCGSLYLAGHVLRGNG
jgi:dihydrofolate synthase/folylpolyglutamate synthase